MFSLSLSCIRVWYIFGNRHLIHFIYVLLVSFCVHVCACVCVCLCVFMVLDVISPLPCLVKSTPPVLDKADPKIGVSLLLWSPDEKFLISKNGKTLTYTHNKYIWVIECILVLMRSISIFIMCVGRKLFPGLINIFICGLCTYVHLRIVCACVCDWLFRFIF